MKPDKRLGQHFLRDSDVLQDIADIADLRHSSGALEIGPGQGALTAFLVNADRPIVAIDKDPRAIEALADRFSGRVRAVLGDAVSDDLGALLPPLDSQGRRPVVVGNLPYNVASPIFRRLLQLGPARVARMVLMFQREVALRIVAQPGTRAYGVPSVMTALVARAHIVRDVPPEAFFPRPKVQSAVVLVEHHEAPLFGLDTETMDRLGRWLPKLFQRRRKVLRHATEAISDLEAAEAAGIDLQQRPERLDPGTVLTLFRSQHPPA